LHRLGRWELVTALGGGHRELSATRGIARRGSRSQQDHKHSPSWMSTNFLRRYRRSRRFSACPPTEDRTGWRTELRRAKQTLGYFHLIGFPAFLGSMRVRFRPLEPKSPQFCPVSPDKCPGGAVFHWFFGRSSS